MGSPRVDAAANTRVDASGNTRVVTQGALFSDATLQLLDASVGAAHRDGSAQVVYVLKASPLSLVSRSVEDLYFASSTFRTDSADTPANTPMLGRLVPPNVRVSVLKGNVIGRSVSTTRGTIKAHNPRESNFDRNADLTAGRGRYDGLRKDYSWSGRAGQMYLGPEDGTFESDFEAFFSCLVRDFDWSEDNVLIVPGPALVEADDVVVKNFYGQGYTVIVEAPGGGPGISISYTDAAEAKETTVGGKPSITSFHTGTEVESGHKVQSLDAVYEDGLAFTPVTDYTEDLQNGTFTLLSPTSEIITCDLHGAYAGPSDTYVDRVGDIIRAVLMDQVGLPIADIATETLGQYDLKFPYECGYYFGAEPATRSKFLGDMLAPLGFSYRGRDGRFRVGYVKNPAEETPDLQLEEKDVISVDRKATLRPVWRVKLGYAPVEQKIELRDFAGAVTESEIARQSNEYRWVEEFDEGVAELHKADELEIETRFSQKADARAVALEMLRLYGKPRDILEVRLSNKFMRYDIGDVIQLAWPRYDIVDDGFILNEDGDKVLAETGDGILKEEDAAGSKYLCVGYVDNPASGQFIVTLWG
jgi:hypothetical protein